MNPSTTAAVRRLLGLAGLLVVTGSLGFLHHAWLIDPSPKSTDTPFLYQILLNVLLLVLGGGTLLYARGQPGRDRFRTIAYGSFLGLAALSVGPALASHRTNVIELLRPLGAILISVGAAGLWGLALARRDQPSDPEIKHLAVIYASVAFAGFAASTVPEMLSITTQLGSQGGLARSPYMMLGLFALPSRLCLFWAAVQPFRRLKDEPAIRKSARSTHIALTVWVILSLLGGILTIFALFSRRGFISSMTPMAVAWRMLAFYALLATAVTSVALSQRNPPEGYKSPPNLNSSGGAEA